MQKNKGTAQKGSRSPAMAFIAGLLAFALSFMAFDANTLRDAFADEGAGQSAAEIQQDKSEPGDDTATLPEDDDDPAEKEQPVEQEKPVTEPEGDDVSASARDGPSDDQANGGTDESSSKKKSTGETPEGGNQDKQSKGAQKEAEPQGESAGQDSESTVKAAAGEQVTSTVTFYSNAASQNPSILARKRATAEAGKTVSVAVNDVTAPAPTSAQAFTGWLYRGDVARNSIEIDPRDGNVELYPVFESGHWLRFSTGVAAGAATEVASQFVSANEAAPATLPVSSRTGYSFEGWFEGSWNGDALSFGAQITHPDGTVINAGDLKKSLASGDVELFAKWVGQPTTYRIVSWHENPDDEGYSFEGFELIGDEAGERAVSGEKTDVSDLPAVAGFTASSVEQKTIEGDGSTLVHAYYDRNIYQVVFHQGRTVDSPLFEELTITAKYGADVHDRWPKASADNETYTAAWYTLPDENSQVFVSGIGTMPLDGAHYYVKNDEGLDCNIVFRLQAVDGSNTFFDYVSQPFTTSNSPWTTADDYKPIKGFMVNAATSDDAWAIQHIEAGDKAATHDSDFLMSAAVGAKFEEAEEVTAAGDIPRHTLYFYYLRCQYDIVFEENGGPDLADVDKVYYEAPLAGLAPSQYVPGETTYDDPSGMTYEFAGWYDNEALIGDEFDFAASEMPAGNIVLYAKWTPKRYLVQADPAGGEFADAGQSSYFWVNHGDSVGFIDVTRNYVADPQGGFVYQYETASNDSDGFGVARYVEASPGDEGKRYRFEEGVYTLFGWYELDGGMESSTPFDFNAAVTRDTSIVARWKAEGVYDIVYNPVMSVEGGVVSGKIDTRLDDGYADLAATYVLNTPTDIEATDGKTYQFVGWKIVENFEEGAPLLVDGLFVEGDGFVVDSGLASDNMIHFQAVYVEVPDQGTDPEPPVDPADPVDPIDPADPIEPSEPVEPVEPMDPSEPSAPADPDEPINPEEPAEPAHPSDSAEPENDDSAQDEDDTIETSPLEPQGEESGEQGTENEGESDADSEEGSEAESTQESDAYASEGATSEQRALAQATFLPKTDDTMMMYAIGIIGIALIAAGVAIVASVVRRRNDDLISGDE